MYDIQEGKCAICKIYLPINNSKICVDHCHTSNNIRGLLCDNCNKGIGFLKDNTEYLLNAVEYLKKPTIL